MFTTVRSKISLIRIEEGGKMIGKAIISASLLLLIGALSFASGKSEAASGPITLRYYQWFNQGPRGEVIAKDVEEFQKLYPNIKIEPAAITNDAYWDRLAIDIASGVEGDICTIDTGSGMTGYYSQRQGGSFIALDDYIKGYKLPDGTNLETDLLALEFMKRNGKTIAMPYIQYFSPHTGLRKSYLAEAGVKPEELSGTWESFKNAVIKLNHKDASGKIDRYGWSHPSNAEVLSRWWHMHWLWTAGGGIFPKEQPPYTADRLIFNSEENVFAVQYLKDLIAAACPPGEKGVFELLSMFHKGSVATAQMALWALGRNRAGMEPKGSFESDFDFVPFPSAVYKGETRKPVLVAWHNPVAISSLSKHPKEAFAFAAFLHSESAQKRVSLFATPVNKRLLPWFEQTRPIEAKYQKMAMQYELRIVPDMVQWKQLDRIVQESVKTALLGLKTPKEALDWGQQEMQKILK